MRSCREKRFGFEKGLTRYGFDHNFSVVPGECLAAKGVAANVERPAEDRAGEGGQDDRRARSAHGEAASDRGKPGCIPETAGGASRQIEREINRKGGQR